MSQSSSFEHSLINDLYKSTGKSKHTHVIIKSGGVKSVDKVKVDLSKVKTELWNYLFETNGDEITVSEVPNVKVTLIVEFTNSYLITEDTKDYINNNFDNLDVDNPEYINSIYNCYVRSIQELIEVDSYYDVTFDGGEYNNQCTAAYMICSDPQVTKQYINFKQRLHFPYIKGYKADILNIHKKAIEYLTTGNVKSCLNVGITGDWDSIINTKLYDSDIPIYDMVQGYGFSYQFKCFLNNDCNDLLDEEVFQEKFITHSDISEGANIEIDYDNYRCLRFFFSLEFNTKLIKIKTSKAKSEVKIKKQFYYDIITDEENENKNTMLNIFLNMLSVERYTHKIYWLDVCDAIYNAHYHKFESGLELFINVTNKAIESLGKIPSFMFSNDYDSNEEYWRCIYYRVRDDKIKITYKTLAWYAKQDSEIEYKKWHQDWYMEAFIDALDLGDGAIAEAFYRLFWLDFYHASQGKAHNKWYQYIPKENKFKVTIDGIALASGFLEMRKIYCIIRANISSSITEDDEADNELLESRIGAIGKIIVRLDSETRKSSYLKALSVKFESSEFLTYINYNKSLTCVRNGVIQVGEDGDVTFRPGKPEDYIMKSFGVTFDCNLSMNHSSVKILLKWFGQIFKSLNDTCPEDSCNPNKNMYLRWNLKYLASFLFRSNPYKIFVFYDGDGDNSKSGLIALLSLLFNDYMAKYPVENFTERNKNPSGPSPQQARLKNMTLAVIDEIGAKDILHGNKVKVACGNDTQYSRGHCEEGEDLKPTVKYIATTNVAPKMFDADPALYQRVVIVKFMAKYVFPNYLADNEYEQWIRGEYRIDEKFENKLSMLASALLWLMFQFYPFIEKEGGLREYPQDILNNNRKYWENNDIVNQFIIARIIKEDITDKPIDQLVKCTIVSIYESYKTWYGDVYPKKSIMDRNALKNQLQYKFGPMNGNGWYGIRVSESDVEYSNIVIGKDTLSEMKKINLQVSHNSSQSNSPYVQMSPNNYHQNNQDTNYSNGQDTNYHSNYYPNYHSNHHPNQSSQSNELTYDYKETKLQVLNMGNVTQYNPEYKQI